jgi:glycosyltransferase involved in cell wall biosynthesis
VANSREVASQFEAIVDASIPVRVIPFLTADQSVAPPLPLEACGVRELRVVYLGRVVPHKRPDMLVREWGRLTAPELLGPARLDIYGYSDLPEFASDLERMIRRSGLEQRIQIHGPYSHDDVDSIMRAADMVVLPSLWEGLPIVLVEAMQRGVPVVTTNVGGIEEFGECNADIIITPSDWDAFVRGMQTMAARLRRGEIDSVRLHRWAEDRYGHSTVSLKWLSALLNPAMFFSFERDGRTNFS